MLRAIIFIKPYSRYILAAWIIAMVIVSSTPDIPTLRFHTGHRDIRLDYLVHFCEYAFLGFMAYLAFSKDYSAKTGRFLVITAALVLFAIADEYHQKLIPGRTYNIRDTLSNVLGIAAALAFCFAAFRGIRKRNERD